MTRVLTALPVYNEVNHVCPVLDEVLRYSPEVLAVDDGSSDGTGAVLAQKQGIRLVTHPKNLGYGAALKSAFDYAIREKFDVLVTIDCDGQHSPQRIPKFVEAIEGWDMVSGSRYLEVFDGASTPPADRRQINERLTAEINRRLGLNLTDAFCGFKAYRVESLKCLHPTVPGYAMPLELWVQAVDAGWKIRELAVPLIYLEEQRSFGGSLDDAETRLRYYYDVLDQAAAALAKKPRGQLCRETTG